MRWLDHRFRNYPIFMAKKYQRKEFLKIALMANVGLCINPFSSSKQIAAAPFSPSEENVIYYRKENKEYDILRKGFNRRIEKYPAVIALCKNVQGITEAIRYAKTK